MSTDKKLVITAVTVLILMGIVGAVREYGGRSYRDNVFYGQDPAAGYGTDNDGYTDTGSTTPSTGGDGVICTADAYQCPNGTWVGRSGPHCEFVCPSTSGTGTQKTTGTLTGTVTLGPTCPVMRNPPDPQCADKPYQTTVVVSTGGKEVGRQTTDASGHFTFSFLPGSYTVAALGGSPLPRCESQTVVLTKAATTTVSLSCDTGIR